MGIRLLDKWAVADACVLLGNRWIHSYSNEIRRPLVTRVSTHAESISTTTTPSPSRLALDHAATTQRTGPSSIITDEHLMTLFASAATQNTLANNH